MTTLPLVVTLRETVATTGCPSFASFELMDWSTVTVMPVPAGTDVAARERTGNTRNSTAKTARERVRGFIEVASVSICSSFTRISGEEDNRGVSHWLQLERQLIGALARLNVQVVDEPCLADENGQKRVART